MTFGVIYGFIWTWGPIIWGLLGLFGGDAAGLILDYLLTKRKLGTTHRKDKAPELVLLVSCDKMSADMVEKVLRNNTASGVGIVKD
jgi:hypothetical protein